jgi:hypothetical protein
VNVEQAKSKAADELAGAVSLCGQWGLTRTEMREVFEGMLNMLPPEFYRVLFWDEYSFPRPSEQDMGVKFGSVNAAKEWANQNWTDDSSGADPAHENLIWRDRVGTGYYMWGQGSVRDKMKVTYTIVPE